MLGIGFWSLGVGGETQFYLTICSCSAITSLQHFQDRISNIQSPQKEHSSLSFKKNIPIISSSTLSILPYRKRCIP